MTAVQRAGRIVTLVAAFSLLAGCGYRASLTRVDPDLTGADKKAAMAAEKQQVDAGLKVAAETRPTRVDDLTVKLQEQPADPFNLPPAGSHRGKAAPFPGDPPAGSPATPDAEAQ